MGLVISLVVTLFWKISVHAGSVAGALVILAIVAGPGVLLAAPLVIGLVAWSRVELGDHTVWQVIGGSLIGALVATAFFGLLR